MWKAQKTRRAIRALLSYGRIHRRSLLVGCLGAVGVVLVRLALPWPLRGIMEVVFPASAGGTFQIASRLPAHGDPMLWLGGAYFAMTVALYEAISQVSGLVEKDPNLHAARRIMGLAYAHLANRTKGLEHLRFAVCFWHSFWGAGGDPFGPGTRVFPWASDPDPMIQARERLDAAFEFFSKLGVPFYCFHDRDLAPARDGVL